MNESPLRTPIPSDPEELERLIDELRSNGESIAAYCKRIGIPAWRLYQAKQRASRRKLKATRQASSAFIPVHIAGESIGKPIELVLSSGHRVLLQANFDEVALRRLLGVVSAC